MAPEQADDTPPWEGKLALSLLAVYFLVFLPCSRFFLSHIRLFSEYGYDVFLISALAFLVFAKKIAFGSGPSAKNPGVFSGRWKQDILIGGIAGGMVLICLPVLDGLVNIAGLDQTELFAHAEARAQSGLIFTPLQLLGKVIVHPILEQVFFTGFLLPTFSKKHNPYLIIYLAGGLFALLNFDFTLSAFTLGVISAAMYLQRGNIIASLIFEMCCRGAGILLAGFYPQVITLTVFLF